MPSPNTRWRPFVCKFVRTLESNHHPRAKQLPRQGGAGNRTGVCRSRQVHCRGLGTAENVVWNARHQDCRVSKRFLCAVALINTRKGSRFIVSRGNLKKSLSEKNDVESMWKACGKHVENACKKNVWRIMRQSMFYLVLHRFLIFHKGIWMWKTCGKSAVLWKVVLDFVFSFLQMRAEMFRALAFELRGELKNTPLPRGHSTD